MIKTTEDLHLFYSKIPTPVLPGSGVALNQALGYHLSLFIRISTPFQA